MAKVKNPAGANGGAFGTVLSGKLNNPKVSTPNISTQRNRAPIAIGWHVTRWLAEQVAA